MPKIDIDAVPGRRGSKYPSPFHQPCTNRIRKPLGDAGGLTQYGVNLLTLEPGAWSSQRHWHKLEDEFVYVLSGQVVLLADAGETVLVAGDCAAFPANDGNGHHLVNRTSLPATVLEIGTRSGGDSVIYPDVDLIWDGEKETYTHRDGKPYPRQDG